jgi:hypothetical protein
MPEKRKEVKTRHDCGLEALDDCESDFRHIPSDETLPPCKYCLRNTNPAKNSKMLGDFWDEMWILESDKTPTIENPDPIEQSLLKLLHGIVNAQGGEKVAQ